MFTYVPTGQCLNSSGGSTVNRLHLEVRSACSYIPFRLRLKITKPIKSLVLAGLAGWAQPQLPRSKWAPCRRFIHCVQQALQCWLTLRGFSNLRTWTSLRVLHARKGRFRRAVQDSLYYSDFPRGYSRELILQSCFVKTFVNALHWQRALHIVMLH